MLKRFWRLETGLFLAIWLTLLVSGRSRLFSDPGSLWHIVVGERILSTGELIRTDPFSFTFGGRPWIAQQWLGECALALLHRVGGLDTVLLATATLLAGLWTWVAHRLLRVGVHPLIAVLLTGMALAGSSYHFHPRPHIITIVLVGWTFARLCDFEAGRTSLKSLFWLVPVYALWTQIHGGMVGGVATVAVAVAGWAFAHVVGWQSPLTSYRQLLPLAGLVLGCALTAFLNPYGPQLPRVWFGLMGSRLLPRIIQEHGPLLSAGLAAWPVVLFGLVYLAALLGTLPRRPRATWLIPLLWLALTWTCIRHGPLFALTAALALGEMYPHIRWREWLARRGSVTCRLQAPDPAGGAGGVWKPALLPALLVLSALVLQATAVPLPGRGWARLDPADSPVELLPELRAYEETRPPGIPIFNDMLFGGFLIYFTPDLKVFVDDRCELYGDQWLAGYAEAYYHHPERIEEWAQEHGFDRALVIPNSAFDRYLRSASGWAVVRRSAGAVLYRRGTPSGEPVPGTPASETALPRRTLRPDSGR